MDDDNNNDTTLPVYPPPFVTEPKGYALSGKIMLSAIIILFAVVVIMVCFHIYARWYILRARRRNVRRARRRTHLVFYIDPHDSSLPSPSLSRGLDSSVIKALPTFTFHPTKNNNTGNNDSDDINVVECAVCLSEFEDNEMGRMLPKCDHCFHVECIDMWFHSHDTCPLCRAPVEVDPTEGDDRVVEVTPGQVVGSVELDPSPSTSVGGRRKGAVDLVGVTVEVPRRSQSFSFSNSDESGTSRSPTSRSPTSRVLSLKRFLSRDKRSPLPSPSGSSIRAELDVELGRVDRSAVKSSQEEKDLAEDL